MLNDGLMELEKKYLKIKSQKPQMKFHWKAGWRTIGCEKFYFRSGWEYKVAKFLQWQMKAGLISGWEYEPQMFWFHKIKRGTITYLPDFRVTNLDATHYWLEVKGYMDGKSLTKIKRFRKYYPNEKLYVLDREWFNRNGSRLPKETDHDDKIIDQVEDITNLLPGKY